MKNGFRRAVGLEHVVVEILHPFIVSDVVIHLAFRTGSGNVPILLVGGNVGVLVDSVVVGHDEDLKMSKLKRRS